MYRRMLVVTNFCLLLTWLHCNKLLHSRIVIASPGVETETHQQILILTQRSKIFRLPKGSIRTTC